MSDWNMIPISQNNNMTAHYQSITDHNCGLVIIKIFPGWTIAEDINGLNGPDGDSPILPVYFTNYKDIVKMLDEYHEWFDPFINGSWFNEALNRGAMSYGKRELEYFGYPIGYFEKNHDLTLE